MSDKTTPKLGTLLDGSEQRDAIHIAVAPVIAGSTLQAGDHVGISNGNVAELITGKPIGIVDPFLTVPVKKGAKFYLFLYPQTITSLRHQWVHPSFPEDEPAKSEVDGGAKAEVARAWLREFADKWNFDYGDMIDAATSRGGYLVAQGIDLHSSAELDEGDEDKFWQCIEDLTGFRAPSDHREDMGWSCSC